MEDGRHISAAPYSTTFHCISAMRYSPKILKNSVQNRKQSSFMLVKHGMYQYTAEGRIYDVTENDIIYLPKGASYRYEVVSGCAECLQFEFQAFDIRTSEAFVICSRPYIFPSAVIRDAEGLFADIIKYHCEKPFGYDCMVLSCISRLYFSAMEHIFSGAQTVVPSKIDPAVQYIKTHFCEKIYVSDLAERCFLSESQLRKLFRESLGMSPIEYKNTLQMNTARELLESGHTVQEIAAILGLDSIYSFSHMFKKRHGVPPSAYCRIPPSP